MRQQSTIGKLIWSIAEIIEHLSAAWELQPGDLIFTGTPEGVAAVGVGDELQARIDGVGTLAASNTSRARGEDAMLELLQLLPLLGLVPRAHRAGAEGPPLELRAGAPAEERAARAGLSPSACRRRLVPLLRDGDGVHLTQSLAIIEYLDETHPEPPLLPATPAERARVRALALDIACEIHPLNNLRVLRYLVHELKLERGGQERLVPALGRDGLEAVERELAQRAAGRYCHGDTPTLADCCAGAADLQRPALRLPARRVPTVMRVFEACMAHAAFAATQPSACPDAA